MGHVQVISVSLFVCTLLFVVTAICGYLYYGQNVDPDLLDDFPSNAFSTLARVRSVFDLLACIIKVQSVTVATFGATCAGLI